MIEFIEPMKAKMVQAPPRHGAWMYELKFDGYRALGLKQGAKIRLLSRNNKDLGLRFPEILQAMQALPDGIFDGEIVALDPQGRSSFQLLQGIDLGAERPPIFYYLFDLLIYQNENWCRKPLEERKDSLKRLLQEREPHPLLRFSEEIVGDPARLLQEVKKLGLEGIIGKKRDSCYEPGLRSGSWIKLKVINEQEFVIGGFTPPKGTRQYFGALVVGYYKKEKLQFAGKVGTGFNEALLENLHRQLSALGREDSPFERIQPSRTRDAGLTAAELKRITWVRPELVCQVRFTEWTNDGRLRHPIFLGLRFDVEAEKVSRQG